MTVPTPEERPGPPDQRWPGWAVDAAIAAAWAAALSAAMSAALAPAALVGGLLAWMAGKVFEGAEDVARRARRAAVRRFLISQMAQEDIRDAVRPAIEGATADGWVAGRRSAEAVVDAVRDAANPGLLDDPAVRIVVDWSDFVPGHPDAAAQVLSADGGDVRWLTLLANAGVTVKGVAEHRLDEIAMVLADGLERGANLDELTTALRGVLDDADWAQMTAWTETNRAMSAAAVAQYGDMGLEASQWQTAYDQRVCRRCQRNEQAGAVPLGEEFPSGDAHPPGHPRCRCALVPVIGDDEFMAELDALAGIDNPPDGVDYLGQQRGYAPARHTPGKG